MKHLRAISRKPALGTTSPTTIDTLITFLIAILTAIKPLLQVLEKTTTT